MGFTIIKFFEEQINNSPDSIAVVCNERQLTYRELNEISHNLALHLQQSGIHTESLVPVCINRSPELIIAILAIIKAGGAYVPIDPEYPLDRIQYMIDDCGSNVVLYNDFTAQKMRTATFNQGINLDGIWSVIKENSDKPLHADITPQSLAYVMYTSGSTGRPKGVMVEHNNITSLIRNTPFVTSTPADTILSTGSISFDATTFEYWSPLLNGGCLVLSDKDTFLNVDALKETILTRNVTKMWFTSTLFNHYVDLDISLFKNLQTILVGGEKLSEQHVRLFINQYPQSHLVNGYGPTENTTFSLIYQIDKKTLGNTIPIGYPLFNRTAYIVNSEGNRVKNGETGEIYVGGDGISRGYLNNIELTNQKFVLNTFGKESAKLYRTGDLGKVLPDGSIAYLGRSDHQIKIRGYRVETGEIESVIYKSDLASQAVVLPKDEGINKTLIAYVVPTVDVVKVREKELYDSHIESWKQLYDLEYDNSDQSHNPETDAEFNIVGWNSSFTGEAIPENEMREWLDDTCNVILKEKPKNVLEVGCGTGLVYYSLTDHISYYYGTDLSKVCIDQINHKISNAEKTYPVTQLKVGAAHDLDIPADAAIDTVIINSVIQYFPGEEYLSAVIAKSIAAVKENGRIILGDIRDKRLLPEFKSLLYIDKLPETINTTEFDYIIQNEVLKEDELCISPEYFYHLKSAYPEITHVDIQWKQGSYINELSLYRYTVIIYVRGTKILTDTQWQHWDDIPDKDNIQKQLLLMPDVLAINDVPNPKLWKERILEKNRSSKHILNKNQLVNELAFPDEATTTVNQLIQFAKSLGYSCRYYLSENRFKINLVFLLKAADSGPVIIPHQNTNKNAVANAVNRPLLNTVYLSIQKKITALLTKSLPDFMIPSKIVMLDSIHMTNNGKIDRQFLIDVLGGNKHNAGAYKAASNATEANLVKIWEDVLQLNKIGIDDNFFDIGGNSLIALQIIARLQKQTEKQVPIHSILKYPTISKFAEFLLKEDLLHEGRSLITLKQGRNKVALYIIPGSGGTVFPYNHLVNNLAPDQPVYGLHARGIDGKDDPFDNISSIAADHITEMLEHNPDGPYALAGYSLGGIVAYEMARQLKKLNKQVTVIAMLDAMVHDRVENVKPGISQKLYKPITIAKKIIFNLKFLTSDFKKAVQYRIRHIKRYLGLEISDLNIDSDSPIIKVRHLHEAAYKAYCPVYCEVNVVVFRAKKRTFYINDKYYGWKHFVKSVTIHDVDGDHHSMFDVKYAADFGKILQQELDHYA